MVIVKDYAKVDIITRNSSDQAPICAFASAPPVYISSYSLTITYVDASGNDGPIVHMKNDPVSRLATLKLN